MIVAATTVVTSLNDGNRDWLKKTINTILSLHNHSSRDGCMNKCRLILVILVIFCLGEAAAQRGPIEEESRGHQALFAWLRGAGDREVDYFLLSTIHGTAVFEMSDAAIAALAAQVTQLTGLVAAQQEQIGVQSRMAEMKQGLGGDFELSKLGKPDGFVPYKTEFSTWEFQFFSYLGNHSPKMRELAETSKVKVAPIPLPTDAAELMLTNKLYSVLSQIIKGSALKIVRRVGHGNGAESYRRICVRWAEQDAYGGLGLVRKIMSFKFNGKMEDLEERIEDFLILKQEYEEHPTTNPIDDDWLKAILVDPERGVPDPLRTHLLLNATKSDWNGWLEKIEEYLISQGKFSQPVTSNKQRESRDAMEVDAIDRKGKGKGKGKKDGKSKDKDKDKKGGGGKASSSSAPAFEGYCSNPKCEKWGHKKSQCWKEGGGAYKPRPPPGLNAVEQAPVQAVVVTPAPTTVPPKKRGDVGMIEYDSADAWADLEDYDLVRRYVLEISRDVNVVELARAQKDTNSKFVMIDSGTYDHVCPPDFAPQFETVTTGNRSAAKAANNEDLQHFGVKSVDGFLVDSAGKAHPTTVKFQVHNVRRVMFSTTKLKRQNFSTLWDAEFGNDALVNVKTRKRFPLIEHGDHNWIRFLVADAPFPSRGKHVQALEDETDIEVGPEEGPSVEEEGDLFDSPVELAPPSTNDAAPGHFAGAPRGEEKEPEIDIMQADIRGEARKARGVGIPAGPGPGEVEIHNLTHMPYRAWCGWCVMSRGQSNQHHVLDAERKNERGRMLQMDYYFMRTIFEDKVVACLSAIECLAGAVISSVVPEKGGTKFAEELVVSGLERFGLNEELVIQVDAEPSIRDLARRVASRRKAKTILRVTPVGSKQSLAYAESSHKSLEGIARTLKSQLESECNVTVLAESEVTPWMVRHAGFIITNFSIRPDGRTPFERLNKVKYASAVCTFGEAVMIRVEKVEVLAAKFTENWVEAIWLGRSLTDDRHLGATPMGVIASRSVRRFPEGDRWNRDLLIECRGTPWNKEGGDSNDTFVLDKAASLPWMPHVYRKAHQNIRAFWQAKGRTLGCKACELGPCGRRHSDVCKQTQKEWKDEADKVSVEVVPANLNRGGDIQDGGNVEGTRAGGAEVIPPWRPEPQRPEPVPSPAVPSPESYNPESEAPDAAEEYTPTSPLMEQDNEGSAPAPKREGEDSLAPAPRRQRITIPPAMPAEAPGTADVVVEPESPTKRTRNSYAIEVLNISKEVKPYVSEAKAPVVMFREEELIQGLPRELVVEGDRKECENMEALKVFEWVKFEDVPVGTELKTTGWARRLKGNGVRSRCVMRDFALTKRFDCFAPTPTPAALRLMMIWCLIWNYILETADLISAFMQAPMREIRYVWPPKEQKVYGWVWKILKAMNGSRTASSDFAEFFAKVMVDKLNFTRGVMEACLYVSNKGSLRVLVHVDDPIATGEANQLATFLVRNQELGVDKRPFESDGRQDRRVPRAAHNPFQHRWPERFPGPAQRSLHRERAGSVPLREGENVEHHRFEGQGERR